jgi:cellulose biosynthesis protein BcsQ
MPVIAVINRKGGSGKSTLATHLAAWLAHQNLAVMLGDVDKQQSTRAWLKRRSTTLPAIVPWALDQKNVLKVPSGVTHVVLDTPGGMQGFELARVVMSADAIVMPVCNSLFDRESAASCHAELLSLPRVASGRCKLGVVGMRLDARTKAADTLRAWAATLNVPFLGVLRETQTYVKGLDNGVTLFDAAPGVHAADLLQWEPILNWLRPVAKLPCSAPSAAATQANTEGRAAEGAQVATKAPQSPQPPSAPAVVPPNRIHTGRAPSLMPAQESMLHGDRLNGYAPGRLPVTDTATAVLEVRPAPPASRNPVPQFLLRH